MPNENMVWAVNAPVPHNPKLARNQTWVNTGGQTGIVGPYSLEVRAQDVPGSSVRVMPGGFAIAATPGGTAGYTSAPRQSYAGDVDQARTVEIDPTGSSGGRTDILGIVINDPEIEGTLDSMSPEQLADHKFWDFHVIKNFSGATTTAVGFGQSRPFLPLARIIIPASTATITSGMIRDIRFMAVRQTDTQLYTYSPPTERNYTGPGVFTMQVDAGIPIPQWATRLVVQGAVTKARLIGSPSDVIGYARPVIIVGSGESYPLERSRIFEVGQVANSRTDITVSGVWNIPPERRGQNLRIWWEFDLENQPGTLRFVLTNTRFDLALHFQESPVGTFS